ncbi:alpha-(1,4)-fucosyltransferase [Populus alba]|nr:alpha-(1,4)-fucosyltransferase-like [Populus alba]KAJ6952496.1 alpha-(1,4)-fucosyltransferase-like [Populus alba x Populus x berolinensis]
MQLKPLNTYTITLMLFFTIIILFFSGFLEFPSITTSITSPVKAPNFPVKTTPDPFTDLFVAFKKWDSQVGCVQFREKHKNLGSKGSNGSASLQIVDGDVGCSELKMEHVNVLVKGWTWIPGNLDNLYSCRCGLSCLWTKSSVLADKPDALLFETTTPPLQRHNGDPLRVYMDLEAGRKRSGREDLFISYHAEDDVQSTYAGALFHNGRNYHVSRRKDNDTLVYWSSSRCLADRNRLAKSLLSLLPHHSFGKCLNNVGGQDMALSFYPECANDASLKPKWWDHLHCAMSHYKFVLAIENTWTESYVTEKLFYALDSGSVPIYFGAPNVLDFVPPHSIIDGNKFKSMEELASYVKYLANDPVAYAEYHAWRRCGVLGNYGKTRAASLDTLPCRLCEAVSRKGGRNARA